MTPQDEELIAELDDVLGAGGIRDLAFHIGQVKALLQHTANLEAAQDHLRARLREQIVKWHEANVALEYQRRWVQEPQLFPETVYRMCAADLLAVLTEPEG